jgi:hypothetical protein
MENDQGGVRRFFLQADSQLQAQMMGHAELNRRIEEDECGRCSGSGGAGSSGKGEEGGGEGEGEGEGEDAGQPEDAAAWGPRGHRAIKKWLRDSWRREPAPSVKDDHVGVKDDHVDVD